VAVPALAADGPPAAGSSADGNLTQWIEGFQKDPTRFAQILEERCIETGSDACKLTQAQLKRMPGEIKSLTEALDKEVVDDPSLAAGAKVAPGGAQTRVLGGLVKAVTAVAKKSSNAAVKKLAANADQIGKISDIADKAAIATRGADALKQQTVVAVSKAVIYSMPLFGDVFSIGEAVAKGDVEQGVVACVSLVATAVALAFPPAGAVIAAAVAVYSIARTVLGWIFGGSDSEEMKLAPPTPRELRERGADVRWLTRRVNGQDVALTISKTGTQVSQILLLDSRWTTYNRSDKPLDYTIQQGRDGYGDALGLKTGFNASDATFQAWQGGREYSGSCGLDPLRESNSLKPRWEHWFYCAPAQDLRIGAGRPAVIKITYTYSLGCMDLTGEFAFLACKPPAESDLASALYVNGKHSNGQGYEARLPIDFRYVIVA
jgi:hypothetical protein